MLDRLTRLQLSIFAVVTVLTVGAISIFYLHLPAAVGIGAYKVDANFVAGGGLYENANVTYRGVTVGRVESVGLTDDGVVAHMRLNSGTPVPDNVTATVKSVSAVGEQYIDLVPPEKPSSAKLRNGASISKDRTAIGQDISGLLDEADKLISSVGDTRLQDLLRETFKAFNGSGPELARLIQSSRLLVDEANANYGQVTQLIDQAGPFLDAQIRGGDDIKSLADGLARFTGEVANADPQLRSTLQTVPGATQAANETFSGIRPSFPVLAANLANFGRIGVIYSKSLEQALVMGADYYESPSQRVEHSEQGTVPLGVGAHTTISKAIVDKNARIGRQVRIVNREHVQEANREDLGFVIRNGIVVVIKNATIPDGMVI